MKKTKTLSLTHTHRHRHTHTRAPAHAHVCTLKNKMISANYIYIHGYDNHSPKCMVVVILGRGVLSMCEGKGGPRSNLPRARG